MDPEFLDLMPATITLTAPTGRNAQGRPTYVGGTPVSFRARIVGPSQSLRRKDSEEETPLYTIWINATSEPITNQYRVGLPNDPAWTDVHPILFSVNRVTDENGPHHVKLTCGFQYHRQGQT